MRIQVLVIFLLAGFSNHTNAQPSTDDSARLALLKSKATAIYLDQRANEIPLYNGRLHVAYPAAIGGFAYFMVPDWEKGQVMVDGVLYTDIDMKYDLVADELVVAQKGEYTMYVALGSERVNAFSFMGYEFVSSQKELTGLGLPDAFYRVLEGPRITAFLQYSKWIEERLDGQQLLRNFTPAYRFYIWKDRKLQMVKNKKELLELLKDKRKEVNKFMKSRSLKFRKEPERTVTEVVDYYNKLGA